MKEIIIEPHIGIGQLKLGMTSDELENALLQLSLIHISEPTRHSIVSRMPSSA